MKAYTLKSPGRSEISATLARFAAIGKFGAPLIEKGFSQALFAMCLANWLKAVAGQLSASELASALEGLSACNASAARQALESCELDLGEVSDDEWAAAGGRFLVAGKESAKPAKDGKRITPLRVGAHWKILSPGAATVDTSKLGF